MFVCSNVCLCVVPIQFFANTFNSELSPSFFAAKDLYSKFRN